MSPFVTLISTSYKQRTRSYAFLITLCASLAIAYTFVPEPHAKYTTLSIAGYIGTYNSAWFGYVSATMTSIFLSLFGFYLVNNSIQTDVDTRVGQMVAATPISNFRYLFSKVLSNLLVLCTIAALVFIMSILLFLSYNEGYPLEWLPFVKPFVLMVLPALFFIAVLALIFEVFLGRYSVVQQVGFFLLFMLLLLWTPSSEAKGSFDVFGSKMVLQQWEQTLQKILPASEHPTVNIGYVAGKVNQAKRFEFQDIEFPMVFIGSRLMWMAFGLLLLFISVPFFHRFALREKHPKPKLNTEVRNNLIFNEVQHTTLPIAPSDYTIFPLVTIEFLMLLRKGKKWLWLLNITGMFLLALLPLHLAQQVVLPMVWFLQVSRLSELTTKEIQNKVQYMAFTAYHPIRRLLVAQVLAAIGFLLLLAAPLLLRLIWNSNLSAFAHGCLGSVCIVLLAAMLGIVSQGKKLFEVLFFMMSHALLNGIGYADYMGVLTHPPLYTLYLLIGIVVFGGIAVLRRNSQLQE